MRRIKLLALSVAFLSLVGCTGQRLDPFQRTVEIWTIAHQHFLVGIEQDGKQIAIRDHQVELRKKPFTIVLYFPQPDGVLVNASFNPLSFNSAKAGKPLEQIVGFAQTGMAEWPFNRDRAVIISDDAPHYWYYNSEIDHRFEEIVRKDNILVGKRTVARFLTPEAEDYVDIVDIERNELYLVFLKTEWTEDFEQIERQRKYLKVIFR